VITSHNQIQLNSTGQLSDNSARHQSSPVRWCDQTHETTNRKYTKTQIAKLKTNKYATCRNRSVNANQQALVHMYKLLTRMGISAVHSTAQDSSNNLPSCGPCTPHCSDTVYWTEISGCRVIQLKLPLVDSLSNLAQSLWRDLSHNYITKLTLISTKQYKRNDTDNQLTNRIQSLLTSNSHACI